MRVHYLQHVDFEGLGSIGPWLLTAGHEPTSTKFFDSSALPSPQEVDFLVIMGGPMSANDEARHPWLAQEKRFIADVIGAGTPVLGVCLGAQLIASALGARVYRNPVEEIGWFPVEGVSHDAGAAFQFLRAVHAFHWHGETFDLPRGAVHLASSPGCRNQAFQVGRSVIGLQFHLEVTPESAREIVCNCRDELSPSRYVQTEEAILSAGAEAYRTVNGLMADVLSFLVGSQERSCVPVSEGPCDGKTKRPTGSP